jgi:hypothetical protein
VHADLRARRRGGAGLAIAALVVGGVVTVADNGAGVHRRRGDRRADVVGPGVGNQNTGQNIVGSLTPVAHGALVGVAG